MIYSNKKQGSYINKFRKKNVVSDNNMEKADKAIFEIMYDIIS